MHPPPSPWGTAGSWLSEDSPREGEERPTMSRERQSCPPCHQAPALRAQNTHAHSVTHSESGLGWAFQCPPTQSLLSIPPSKAWGSRSLEPSWVLRGPHKCLKGCQGGASGRGWARDRTASQLLWDQIHCYMLSRLKSEMWFHLEKEICAPNSVKATRPGSKSLSGQERDHFNN